MFKLLVQVAAVLATAASLAASEPLSGSASTKLSPETMQQVEALLELIDFDDFTASRSKNAKFNLVAAALNELSMGAGGFIVEDALKFASWEGAKLAAACEEVGQKLVREKETSPAARVNNFVLDVCALVPKSNSLQGSFDVEELPPAGSAGQLRDLGAKIGIDDKVVATGRFVRLDSDEIQAALDKTIAALSTDYLKPNLDKGAELVFGRLRSECAKYAPLEMIFNLRELGYDFGDDKRSLEAALANKVCWQLNFYGLATFEAKWFQAHNKQFFVKLRNTLRGSFGQSK